MISHNADDLKKISKNIRVELLKSLHAAKSGHTGGSLSSVDILSALFFNVMRHDPSNPQWDERDRFILSKGHGAPALYTTLAVAGYFPTSELSTLRKLGSRLQGHPDRKIFPYVEVSTGSLGQGLAMAGGISLALRLRGSTSRVYALLGDGECQEGMVWESAMSSAHFKIDNLCAIVDNNGLQIDGSVENIMEIEPLAEKWRSFGWNAIEVNGHDAQALLGAFSRARETKGRPSVIIADTVKGKGVSFFENKCEYHGVPPSDDELARALKELE